MQFAVRETANWHDANIPAGDVQCQSFVSFWERQAEERLKVGNEHDTAAYLQF